MKKFLICEIVIALFALTGFYYFLSFERPVRMPVRPVTSELEVIASLPSASGPQPEATVEPVTADTVATPPPAEAAEPVAGSVTGAAAGDVPVVVSEKSIPENSGLRPVVQAQTAPAGSQTTAVDNQTLPAAGAKDDLPAPELQPGVEDETSPAPPAEAVIVAGEYVLHNNLRRNLKRLEKLGFVARTEEVVRPTLISRVYLGPFTERRKAQEMISVAREKGDDPFLLIRAGTYRVVVGSFYLQSSVDDWKKLYGTAGLTLKVQKVSVKMPHSLILLDLPRVQQSADTVLARLHDAGFPDAHLR